MPLSKIFSKILVFVTISFLFLSSFTYSNALTATELEITKTLILESLAGEYHPTRFMVKYKNGVTEKQVQDKAELNSLPPQNYYKTKQGPIFQTINVASNSDLEGKDLNDPKEQQILKDLFKDKMIDTMTRYTIDPDVESVNVVHKGHLDWTDSGTQTYSDDFDQTLSPSTGKHWYYSKTKLPEVWDDQNCATGGVDCGGDADVVVAVIDSGVAFENYTATFDYTDQVTHILTNYGPINFTVASELNGINLWNNPYEAGNSVCEDDHGVDVELWADNLGDYDPADCLINTDKQKEGHPNDDYGHGTYVAGMIASLTNNAAGSVGSGHNISIMPIKINIPFTGGVWEDTFLFGVVYAVDYGATVINASLGWPYYDPHVQYGILQQAVEYAEEAGVPIVVSSGNDGDVVTGLDYPAQFSNPNVIAVGAVNYDNSRSSYSQYGSSLDIVAPVGEGTPGDGIHDAAYQQTLSCACGEGIACSWECDETSDFTDFASGYGIGTSFAAPQVSAGVALLITRGHNQGYNIGINDINSILQLTSTDLGSAGKDNQTGYGLLNLENIWNKSYFIGLGNWKYNYGWPTANYLPGDFNNDNFDDIAIGYPAANGKNNWWVMPSNGTSFTSGGYWKYDYGWPTANYLSGDFDNDGFIDDIAIGYPAANGKNNWWVMPSNGTSFTSGGYWKYDYGWPTANYLSGDFDNDGFIDDIAIGYPGVDGKNNWWVMKSNGTGFSGGGNWKSSYGWPTANYLSGDFDNDGFIDDIAIGYPGIDGKNNWWVMKSNGTGFSGGGNWKSSYGWPTANYLTGDFDNDTYKDDIAIGYPSANGKNTWWMMISNGITFSGNGYWKIDYGWPTANYIAGDYHFNGSIDSIAIGYPDANGKNNWWVMSSI